LEIDPSVFFVSHAFFYKKEIYRILLNVRKLKLPINIGGILSGLSSDINCGIYCINKTKQKSRCKICVSPVSILFDEH
jgi:hypothetical protein